MKGTTQNTLTHNTQSSSSSSSWCIHNIHHPPFSFPQGTNKQHSMVLILRCVFCIPPSGKLGFTLGGRGRQRCLPSNSHQQVPGLWRDDTAQTITGISLIPGIRSVLGREGKGMHEKRGVAEFGRLTGILDDNPS